MSVALSPDVAKIRRKTDSLLDWLGDWGGLLDSLYFLADILVSPFSAFMMKSKLTQLLVKIFPSESTLNEISKKEDYISKYFDSPDDPKRTKIL